MICEAINNAAKFCLPTLGGVAKGKSKGILGWNEYVKPYQAESKFWFGVWQAAGRPRRLKRAKSQIVQDKFTQKFLNGRGDIFKEIKKFRGQNTTISILQITFKKSMKICTLSILYKKILIKCSKIYKKEFIMDYRMIYI